MPFKDKETAKTWWKKHSTPEKKKIAKERTAKWRKEHPDYNAHQRELYKKSKTSRRNTAKEYYVKNHEKIRKIQLQDYKELRDIVLRGYSKNIPKCVCCKVSGNEFLAIDHIEGRVKMDSNSKLKKLGYSSKLKSKKLLVWLKNNDFPEGFQVLCHNCNTAKFQLGKCPHERKR